jgi:hypothetical protein
VLWGEVRTSARSAPCARVLRVNNIRRKAVKNISRSSSMILFNILSQYVQQSSVQQNSVQQNKNVQQNKKRQLKNKKIRSIRAIFSAFRAFGHT